MSLGQDQIAAAIAALKQKRPDAWEKMKANELQGSGHANIDTGVDAILNIDTGVDAILNKAANVKTSSEYRELFMAVRRAVREEAGLAI